MEHLTDKLYSIKITLVNFGILKVQQPYHLQLLKLMLEEHIKFSYLQYIWLTAYNKLQMLVTCLIVRQMSLCIHGGQMKNLYGMEALFILIRMDKLEYAHNTNYYRSYNYYLVVSIHGYLTILGQFINFLSINLSDKISYC
jgi:hypothetical protein